MNACLGLWYQKGIIFGVSFWERKKFRKGRWSITFFLLMMIIVILILAVKNKDMLQVRTSSGLSIQKHCATFPCWDVHKHSHTMIRPTFLLAASPEPQQPQVTFPLLFLKMSVMMVTHYIIRYLKKSKWGSWTCSIILLNVSIMPVLISKYKKR